MLALGSGDYDAQEVLTLPVGDPVSFGRGWAAIDAKFQGRKFRFVTTHLEVEDFADTQEAQGQEFLAGPARARGPVIATGDFNSAADPAHDLDADHDVRRSHRALVPRRLVGQPG